jgi:peptide methionine sulfoxide reductase msrA/msrB
MSKLRALATGASIFLFGAVIACAGEEPSQSAEPASDAPVAFSLTSLDGKTVSLSDFKGKKVYVKFWATWCSICLAGLREVDELAADTHDDIEVLTVVSPGYLGERNPASFTAWAKTRDFHFPVLLDVDGKLASSLGVHSYPTSMWIDPKGALLSIAPGQVSNVQIADRFTAGKSAPKQAENPRFPPNPNVGVDYTHAHLKDIWLAGGCFWGVEAYMTRIYGVADAESGYANGPTAHPSYEDVCASSGHAETVHVQYDPERVSLDRILHSYFKIIDPTVRDRQGNDAGVQYRTGIYYRDPTDGELAAKIRSEEQTHWAEPIVTEVLPLTQFAKAEAYHQDYLEKHPNGYCHTDFSSLTNASTPATSVVIDPKKYRKPDDATLRARLTPEQYAVTQTADTERAFSNQYLDSHAPGVYVDVATGEPLFSSTDKFDSGCGWPSFAKPIDPDVVRYVGDHQLGMERTEVRSRVGNSHLGHVFDDGPAELGGRRFCINSSSIRFVPVESLEKEGYGDLRVLFGEG